MHLSVIACGVLEPELEALAQESPHDIDLHILDAGLHATPKRLRRETQAAIDRAVGVDAVVLGYGLCGRGVAGLTARHCPLVLPRAHDCMTLFLGSRAAYGKQFKAHPGTYYLTPGWYEKSVAPKHGKEDLAGRDVEAVRSNPQFAALMDQYGEENARYIVWFQDSWKRNYTRVAFIDTGVGDVKKYEQYARHMAEALGWTFERIEADLHLVRALLFGEWDSDEVLVVQPGQRVGATGDEDVLTAIDQDTTPETAGAEARCEPRAESTPAEILETVLPAREVPSPSPTLPVAEPTRRRPVSADEPLALGIDAGGTYTDVVVCTLEDAVVLSKAKAPTTPHDLSVGIRQALSCLGWPAPSRIRSVSLSTTLATNAIAENKGGMPGLLMLPGVSGAHIDWPLQRPLPGQISISGEETEPVNTAATMRAIEELLAEGADAFAVVGYASVRNPAHELAVRDLVQSRCDLPVVCGHELSPQLNLINRANTALLNARLFPPIRELIVAARKMLHSFGVTAPLWVVKGDGSLMNEETALARPIDTLLSGPAASVSGARLLAGLSDALVVDMGGTTTDTAVLENGVVRLKEDGLHVNGWTLNVVAADIATVGLGGDSRIDFTPNRTLTVGPDRAVPLCFLAGEHPRVGEELARFDSLGVSERGSARALEYLTLRREPPAAALRGNEPAIIAALRGGPLTCAALAKRLGLISTHLLFTDSLEARGYLVRAALTPTDVLHATGQLSLWDREASRHALRVFSDLFGAPPRQVAAKVLNTVIRKLCDQVVQRELGVNPAVPDCRRLLDHALEETNGAPLRFQPHYRRPLVAIGAPVEAYFPSVIRRLSGRLVIPPHAEVANAVGAAASEVLVREVVVVRPAETGAYLTHSRAGRKEFTALSAALNAAQAEAHRLAEQRARHSGASTCRVNVRIHRRDSYAADGTQVFIEARVEATAAGKATGGGDDLEAAP